ncbi:MAG: bifunctional hydroxymethylpyrimidine kinase/phosphomethylpyrimidine kinase [Oscillospiraceae bacterium]|nr:bifunctional hydroxymethylpyrimidine kinase/phosphomethylpyrimidine kinase [Oscillospiraceae bacterium]MBR6610590.1 bifunctional hydroxymethylpyrimidine kinase/phosphomethylpyrimidine kinase [Oscillospiraceae bacterium]
MSIVVMGATFVDIKGFPVDAYIPTGRNVGYIEYVHGGVARNVVEDIANLELRPTFLGIVDESPLGVDVVKKLNDHKVNTEYIMTRPEGMGTWLAVFDNNGDVAGSISVRPDMMPLVELLEEKGDEIFSKASSIVFEVDLEKEIVKAALDLCEKHNVRAYSMVSNMSIAAERRDFLQRFECFICNQGEAGILFLDDYSNKTPQEMADILAVKVKAANIKSMVVTMGEQGAVYATIDGVKGVCPARNVAVKDTTGAGDAFCAGVVAGLTYGKTLPEAIDIGSMLAASVITSSENVCPRFLPREVGIDIDVID